MSPTQKAGQAFGEGGKGAAWPGAQPVGRKPKNQRGAFPTHRKVGLTFSTKEAGLAAKVIVIGQA